MEWNRKPLMAGRTDRQQTVNPKQIDFRNLLDKQFTCQLSTKINNDLTLPSQG